MSDAKFTLAVLQRISEFLADLPEEHLAEIADGRARLTFVPAGAEEAWKAPRPAGRNRPSRAVVPELIAELDEIRGRLDGIDSREEGRAYLSPMRLKQELRPLAKLLGVGGYSSMKHADLVDALVERTIGSRLNSAAIRQL